MTVVVGAPNQKDVTSKVVLLYSILMRTARSGGPRRLLAPSKLRQSNLRPKKQNKAFLKHVQQAAQKRICKYQS